MSRVGLVAGRQDGGAILERDSNHPRFPAIGEFHFVAERVNQHAVRRRAGPAPSEQLRAGVADAGNQAFLRVEPIVAHNAADRRNGPREEGAVPDRCHRRKWM